MGNSNSFELLPSQRSCSYKLRLEDIGRRLQCECIMTDVFGRSSEPAYAETATVSPGLYSSVKVTYTCELINQNLNFNRKGVSAAVI